MVNVLIIGATGYIGQAVAQSLVRSGDHRVYGLARSPEKAKLLEAQEVIAVIGSISDSKATAEAILKYRISVVVDITGANQESHDLLALVQKVSADRLSAASKSGIKVPKLGFVYGSGMWVHGHSDDAVDDLVPVGVPEAPTPSAELLAWRPSLEQKVIAASEVLDTVVIRPAMVYGRSSGGWTYFLSTIEAAAKNGDKVVSIPADVDSRPCLVHVDDVARGFHCAIDKLPLISRTGVYPIFDLVTSQESMRDILVAAAREFGFKGTVELAGAGDNLFMRAMSTNINGNSNRARKILGWEPKKHGFVPGMDVFVKAWIRGK